MAEVIEKDTMVVSADRRFQQEGGYGGSNIVSADRRFQQDGGYGGSIINTSVVEQQSQ